MSGPAKPNALVGTPMERVEDLRFLRGRGTYVDDLAPEGLLSAAVVRSPVAHGEIVGINATQALSMPGVHAVITAADIGGDTGGEMPVIPLRRPMPEAHPFLQPVIAKDVVRYVGEPVALVVADSAELAEDAAEAVEVEIRPLPVAMTFEDATDPAKLLFPDQGTNAIPSFTALKGDAEAAFAKAAYTRKEKFGVQRHTAFTMETRGLLAIWDEEKQEISVSGAAKIPFFNKRALAKMMDLPESAVHYLEYDVGGGFGARGEFYPEDFLVAFAARKLNRPVKWIEDRREHFMAINHARETECEIEIACDADGVILGLRGTVDTNLGGYVRPNGMTPARNIAQFMTGPYAIENIALEARPYVSDKTPVGTYRAPGRYEGCFFMERLMDMIAEDFGIDRIEIRRRNLVPQSAMPYPLATVGLKDAYSATECDSGDYAETMDSCLAKFGWQDKLSLDGKLIDGRYHGIGIGCFVEGGSSGPRETARLSLDADGTVLVAVGSSAIGQGLETVMTQIAADELEIPVERIRILHGSTTLLDEGFGSYHSRATVMGGNAVLLTARTFIDEGRAAAAKRLGCEAAEVSYSAGTFVGPGGASLGFADLAGEGIVADGHFANQNKQTYSYGTACAHVAVDPRTGAIELLEYLLIEDVGRVINPGTLHGQAVGSTVQGLGSTISEHLVYDANGQLLVGTLADYIVPLASDYPNIEAISTGNHPSPNNPLGAKGAGEGGIVVVGGTVANAVASALKSTGAALNRLPLTPAAVWEMAGRAKPAA